MLKKRTLLLSDVLAGSGAFVLDTADTASLDLFAVSEWGVPWTPRWSGPAPSFLGDREKKTCSKK